MAEVERTRRLAGRIQDLDLGGRLRYYGGWGKGRGYPLSIEGRVWERPVPLPRNLF